MTGMARGRIQRYAEEYVRGKEYAAQVEERNQKIRALLMEVAEAQGERDDVGHQWLPAGDYMVKRERRQKVQFSPEQAEEWLRKNGWYDDDIFTVPEETVVIPAHQRIDEDTLAAFVYKKQQEDPDFAYDGLPEEAYKVTENYALRVSKEEDIEY